MQQQTTIGVFGCDPDNRNLGVGALAGGIVAGFSASTVGNLELVFFVPRSTGSRQTVRSGNRQIELVVANYRLTFGADLRRNLILDAALSLVTRLIPSRRFGNSLCRHRPILRAMSVCSLIVDINGGDSFSDIYGLRAYLKAALLRWVAIARRKPMVLLPQTYGPYNHALSRFIARRLIAYARITYSRDHKSIEVVKELFRHSPARTPKLQFSPDVALLVERINPDHPAFRTWTEKSQRAGVPIVGVNASGLLHFESTTGTNRFGLRSPYLDTMRLLVTGMLRLDFRVLLLPHVYNYPIPADRIEPENDAIVLSRILDGVDPARKDEVFLVSENYGPAEIRGFIEPADFFVGTRMHACIASLSLGKPTVALAYSDKYAGLFGSLGLSRWVCDLRSHSSNDVWTFIDARMLEARYAPRPYISLDNLGEQSLLTFQQIVKDAS